MNITETLMREGSFSLELDEYTPNTVRDQMRRALGWTGDTASFTPRDGVIIVTQDWLPAAVVNPSAGMYTGVLWKMEGSTFEGAGLPALIGAGGHPARISTAGVTTDQDAEGWVDSFVASGANGITKGTVTADATTYTTDWKFTRISEFMDKMCAALGFEWRINPDGTLDVDTAANLFTTGAVLVTRQTEGQSGNIRGLDGSVVSTTIDSSKLTSQVRVADAAKTLASASAGSTVAYGLGGVVAVLRRLIDAPGETAAGAGSLATATLNLYKTPRFGFEVYVKSGHVREYVEPGDTIYVYDPPDAVDRNNSVPVLFQGRPTFPVSVRVQQIRYPVLEGHGVYLYRDSGTVTVTDLTPYVVWPDRGAWLTVGSSQGAGDVAVASGAARYDPVGFARLI